MESRLPHAAFQAAGARPQGPRVPDHIGRAVQSVTGREGQLSPQTGLSQGRRGSWPCSP